DGRFLGVNYLSDDRFVASVVWDSADRKAVRTFRGPETVIIRAFSPDRRTLAASRKNSIALFDIFTGKERSLDVDFWVDDLAFRFDGRLVACSSRTVKEAWVLDVETGVVKERLAHPAGLWSLAWSPDGRLLAAGSDEKKVHVWDATTWHEQAVLEG